MTNQSTNHDAHHEHLERFIVFPGTPDGWVLRDTSKRADYLFLSKEGANEGIKLLVDGFDLVGSPAKLNAYGQMPILEEVEL